MKDNQIELLAPAGSYEGLEAAIYAGADAVYLGGALFGARAYAKNFQPEEVLRAIDFAHLHKKKIYLTVNTLLKNREMEEQLFDYLKDYYREGLDAVIVQDMGVFSFVKEEFPGLHLHASTQMTVTGPASMKYLEDLGASRIVTARELSLKEIALMRQSSSIEIESFVHGALCYSYSGQCLMSSLLGGRSGNRGRCAQPCRLPYKADQKELCPLSLKDICTIEILPEIIQAGVTSLKIEGRMKQPAYTAGVTSVYRKYLDQYLEHEEAPFQVSKEDKTYLLDLFNRGGSCSGYYQMHNGRSMMAFTNEKKTGDVNTEIRKRKEKIHGILILSPGNPVILKIAYGDIQLEVSAGEVQLAQKQPVDEAQIRRQMEKLGNTEFIWESLEVQMNGTLFVPMKTLNEVRREALDLLKDAILKESRREEAICKAGHLKIKNKNADQFSIYVSCENPATASKLCQTEGIRGLYLTWESMTQYLDMGLGNGLEMYLMCPHITRAGFSKQIRKTIREWIQKGMTGILVRNLESFAILKREGLASYCVLDHNLYTWNNEAVQFWNREHVMRNTIPLELNEGELRHRDNSKSELLIYGYLPMMISAQCVQKNMRSCNHGNEIANLQDRYQKTFRSRCYCDPWNIQTTELKEPCYNIIYNSIPYGLLNESRQVAALGVSSLRLSFTMESPAESLAVLKEFQKVYLENKVPSKMEVTKGHFKRGAE